MREAKQIRGTNPEDGPSFRRLIKCTTERIRIPQEEAPFFLYLPAHPGLSPDLLEGLLDSGLKALVIEGYHSGTINMSLPTEDNPEAEGSLLPFLEHAREKRVPVFMTFGAFPYPVQNESWYYNFAAFDNTDGLYSTTVLAVNAGLVPLKAKDEQMLDVTSRLEQILRFTGDYEIIIDLMNGTFPFASSLEEIRAFCNSNDEK